MRYEFSLSPAVLLGALILLSSGCADETRPTGPTSLPAPPAPPPASGPFTLYGVVLDYTSAVPRPQSGVPLLVRSWRSPGALLEVTSDDNGRYIISGVPRGAVTIQPSVKSDYRAPCPPGTDVLSGNATFDVHVVSTKLLSTSGAPASMPRTAIWFSGAVFETTSEGRRPIAGATVNLAGDNSDQFVYATTLTDSRGQYLVCTAPPGVGTDQLMWVQV